MKELSRKQKTAAAIGGVALVAAAGSGAAAVVAGDDDATSHQIEGPALQKAEQAALQETGGGTVTGTEVDDEDSKYEVEVTLEDGSQVDVQLDQDFHVVSSDADHEDDPGDGGD